MLETVYAIVHAYHFIAPDMRLGVVIYSADHVRTTSTKTGTYPSPRGWIFVLALIHINSLP